MIDNAQDDICRYYGDSKSANDLGPVPPRNPAQIAATAVRQHRAPPGECKTCDEQRAKNDGFHPPHDASPRCESGKHEHCSCDLCF